jgi:hypothetical protein
MICQPNCIVILSHLSTVNRLLCSQVPCMSVKVPPATTPSNAYCKTSQWYLVYIISSKNPVNVSSWMLTTAMRMTTSSIPAFLCMKCLAHNRNPSTTIVRMYDIIVKTVRPHPRLTGLSDRGGQPMITSHGVVVPPGMALES